MANRSTTKKSTARRKRAPRKKPTSKESVKAPKGETRAKTQQDIDEEELPVSDDVVKAPPIDPHPPAPMGYKLEDRVVIPDLGSRHGRIEQIDDDEDLLLVELDGAIVDPNDPTRKVYRIEIEQDRCRVCHGGRAA